MNATIKCGFYGTDSETYYATPSGRVWLVNSVDNLPSVREVDAIPAEATSADQLVTPEEAIEWCGQIEAASGESLLSAGSTEIQAYRLTSTKGDHGTVTGYPQAVARAKEIQAEIQAAYGVDVSDESGHTVFTAE